MAELEARKVEYSNTGTQTFANGDYNWGLVAFQLFSLVEWT